MTARRQFGEAPGRVYRIPGGWLALCRPCGTPGVPFSVGPYETWHDAYTSAHGHVQDTHMPRYFATRAPGVPPHRWGGEDMPTIIVDRWDDMADVTDLVFRPDPLVTLPWRTALFAVRELNAGATVPLPPGCRL